ncbi:MAG: argininosuccinate lyase [Actinobacteria bacterium]|nr:argininosuccinate lyase [Actinomycetota bacterium]
MLWGGRFGAGPDPKMFALSASIDVDIVLLGADVAATKAHARVLQAAGLLDADEVGAVDATLDELLATWRAGELGPGDGDEDVHSLVERSLTESLGETGRKIHAGRSRNDLVATDVRLYCKDAAGELAGAVTELIEALAVQAEAHTETVMPGFTHMQPAQPVSAGFHLLAHGFALLRDLGRIESAGQAADVSPLGAGALAGTTLPLDAKVAAEHLGFGAVFDNAMDAVSDRDFACDLLYATALLGVHLSRLAEEIVLWASPVFGFARLPDEWSTGSSMMPQKRNPDMAELIRGRSGPAIGDLMAMLTLLKGLPLAYDRDMQEDKELLFRSVGRALGCARGMTAMVSGIVFDEDRLARVAEEGAMWATDLAEILVGRGVSFRAAHETVGHLVALVEDSGDPLDATALTAAHDAFEVDDLEVVDASRGMRARLSHGGTAPERVQEQLAALRSRLASGG